MNFDFFLLMGGQLWLSSWSLYINLSNFHNLCNKHIYTRESHCFMGNKDLIVKGFWKLSPFYRRLFHIKNADFKDEFLSPTFTIQPKSPKKDTNNIGEVRICYRSTGCTKLFPKSNIHTSQENQNSSWWYKYTYIYTHQYGSACAHAYTYIICNIYLSNFFLKF